ncbi:trypsin-like serine protease [Actinomadura sp. KC06]|uniref:trypsin-like serine protease n=1 Tax=Actinomadura sp. KC06 TaxID=2530369 RepID=UPI00104FCFBD|nr:trypsin-like serine protease [Actinomadura sp. KC06]TDD28701.1 trypsin-like serine protease [Actinomadura sp. KC06]
MRAPRLIVPLALVLAATILPLTGQAAADQPRPRSTAAIPTDQLQPGTTPAPGIVNGQRASYKDHPSIIAGLRVGGGGPQGASCTASVVGKRTILTAAHCMIDVTGAKSYVYGDDDLNSSGDEVFRTKVAKFVTHPQYRQANDWKKGYDVAVVTTEDDIPVPQSQWAKVAGSGDSALTQPGKSGVVLGFGKHQPGELYTTTLPINDPNGCQVFDVRVNGEVMLCTGYDDGHTGICSGDSGGPFTVDGVVVGVVSWGAGTCDRYGVMARLTNEMGDWAKKTIGTEPGDGTFGVGVSPASGKVEPGKHVSTTVTSQPGTQGAEKLDLSASGLPAGATATFQPSAIDAGGTAKLTVQTSASTPEGTYKITVNAKGASGTKTTDYTLTVGAGGDTAGPQVAISPASGTVQRGGFARATITVTGGTGASRLSGSGTGLFFAPFFNPPSVEPGGTSQVTVVAPFTPGTYKINITATDGASRTGGGVYTLTVQ